MPKIALITLRNDYLNDRKERRDSIDVELYSFLKKFNFIPFLIPNDYEFIKNINLFIQTKDIGCILFSGGNDLEKNRNIGGLNTYHKRDEIELYLIKYCLKNKIPLIGICRGFQMIADFLGADIEKVEGHVNTIHEVTLENIKNINVNSFHSFGLKNKNLPDNIEPLGYCKFDGTLECFRTEIPFRSLNFMWHPERDYGSKEEVYKLIKDFLFE